MRIFSRYFGKKYTETRLIGSFSIPKTYVLQIAEVDNNGNLLNIHLIIEIKRKFFVRLREELRKKCVEKCCYDGDIFLYIFRKTNNYDKTNSF